MLATTTSEARTLAAQLDPLEMAELLQRRMAGEPFPYSFIRDADPYSAAPEDLVQGAPGIDPGGQGKEVAWYFCWRAKCHGTTGGGSTSKRKRKVAAAGETYWHPETGKQDIKAGTDGKSVGAYRRTLSYVEKIKNQPKNRLGWCMVEIGFHGPDQLMLCKLYKPHRPHTHPETSGETSVACPALPPAPLGAEIPISRVAIVRKGSAAGAAVTDVIDFSGSSIPPTQRLRDMANLVRGMESPAVVLSAMGNTTSIIRLAAWKALKCGPQEVCEIHELNFIKELHLRMVIELGLRISTVSGSLDELDHQLQHVSMTKELSPWTQDYLVSFGERTSTKIFYEYLNKLEGTLQVWKLRAIATSGRGSTHMTATTIDRALESREIQVWKDEDGIFRCDPKVCADATLVPHLTFDEAAELSDFAEQSMKLAMEYGISIRVRNPNKPQAPGTVITKTRDTSESTLTSIVLKSNITMLDIKSKRMQGQSEFVMTVLSKFILFEYLGISVDCVPASGGNMSILVPSELLCQELIKKELDNVVEELQRIAEVHRRHNVSVISLIGNSHKSSSIEEKARSVLLNINAEVYKLIWPESSKVMKAFLVVEKSREKDCVQALHSTFFEKGLVSEVGGAENVPQVPDYSSAMAVSRSDIEETQPTAPPCGDFEWHAYSSVLESIDDPFLSNEFLTNLTGDDDDLILAGLNGNPGACYNGWAAEDLDVEDYPVCNGAYGGSAMNSWAMDPPKPWHGPKPWQCPKPDPPKPWPGYNGAYDDSVMNSSATDPPKPCPKPDPPKPWPKPDPPKPCHCPKPDPPKPCHCPKPDPPKPVPPKPCQAPKPCPKPDPPKPWPKPCPKPDPPKPCHLPKPCDCPKPDPPKPVPPKPCHAPKPCPADSPPRGHAGRPVDRVDEDQVCPISTKTWAWWQFWGRPRRPRSEVRLTRSLFRFCCLSPCRPPA